MLRSGRQCVVVYVYVVVVVVDNDVAVVDGVVIVVSGVDGIDVGKTVLCIHVGFSYFVDF